MTKFCRGCKLDRKFAEFHKGNSKHGLKSRCIACCKINYDPLKARDARRRHQQNNKEEYRARSRQYDKEHKAERTARENFRRAQKLKATPLWLTSCHKEEIVELYRLRERLTSEKGIIYHVDHVVPLINKDVCGLHVPWNLQVIPSKDNLKKGNRVI